MGDLSAEIDENLFQQAFLPFGSLTLVKNKKSFKIFCRSVKIIRDMTTMKTKGYGFVSFAKFEDAERAIKQMNGIFLGRRRVRTNWAARKQGIEV